MNINNNIEGIIERKNIKVNLGKIKEIIENKNVLVTGGAGSIGFELCRQLLSFNPKQIIIFDIYENASYMAYQRLLYNNFKTNIKVIIGSVYNKKDINDLFLNNKIDIIFHAAAYKHVPLMEEVPHQAILSNCIGTLNVCKCANKYKVEKMVFISTDKAINPISVMGASKKIAEQIVLQQSNKSKTKYSIVRFGNVFNSNGSLIPILIDQIQNTKEITLTSDKATRYFMNIDDAISLILQSLLLESKNKVFMLDMNEQKNIKDIAYSVIKALNYKPEEDIKIKIIGLRKAEKLTEEIIDLSKYEKTEYEYIYSQTLKSLYDKKELDNFLKNILSSSNIKNDILNFANKDNV